MNVVVALVFAYLAVSTSGVLSILVRRKRISLRVAVLVNTLLSTALFGAMAYVLGGDIIPTFCLVLLFALGVDLAMIIGLRIKTR